MMKTIFAEYNPQRNSIDVYTSAGYMLRIDCCPLCPFRSVPVREMALECAFQKKVEKSKMRPSARRGRAQRKCKQ